MREKKKENVEALEEKATGSGERSDSVHGRRRRERLGKWENGMGKVTVKGKRDMEERGNERPWNDEIQYVRRVERGDEKRR